MHEIERSPRPDAARILDRLCFDAEQGDPAAAEVLVSLVDLVVDPRCSALVQDLRKEAARVSLPSLARLVRLPKGATPVSTQMHAHRHANTHPDSDLHADADMVADADADVDAENDRRDDLDAEDHRRGGVDAEGDRDADMDMRTRRARAGARAAEPSEAAVPEYVKGRSLTLGERKALARQPTRRWIEKLLLDPSAVVIQMLLHNPTVVERDVVRLAARRPNRPDVLVAIAHNSRWSHRKAVRIAIILNPEAPLAVAVPLLALLSRSELMQVARSPSLDTVLRAEAHERLARRPPFVQSSAKIQQ